MDLDGMDHVGSPARCMVSSRCVGRSRLWVRSATVMLRPTLVIYRQSLTLPLAPVIPPAPGRARAHALDHARMAKFAAKTRRGGGVGGNCLS
jgi:hypothetical protein